MALYLLVVPVVYVCSVITGNRRRFCTAFLTFVLVFPVVLSYLNLAVSRSAVAFGFSGVVMAFVGYLPFALATYLDSQFNIGARKSLAPALFFFSLALIAVLSIQLLPPDYVTVVLGTSGVAFAALLSALLYAIATYEQESAFGRKVRAAVQDSGYFELTVIGVMLFLFLPFVAFPADPSVGGGTLNLYIHLLGYTLGFMVTYVTVEVAERLNPERRVL